MNIDNILKYEADPSEDFYSLLGCDPSSSEEQILAEFKARAKNCHPDKCTNQDRLDDQATFQNLLQVSMPRIAFYVKVICEYYLCALNVAFILCILGQGNTHRPQRETPLR